MANIVVKLLGGFDASIDGKAINFKYKKVEALFCYLIVKKHATRYELSNLLWSDKEDSTAKKNLRNAIFRLKESIEDFDKIFIIIKSTVELNPDISISTDFEQFLNNESEIDIYHGDFLQNYSIKNADNFESWIIEIRDYLRNIYLKRLNDRIKIEKSKNNFEQIEKYCKLLVKADEFDENAYRNLIDCYKQQRKFNSGFEIYDKLSEILDKELSITPEVETEKAFAELLKEMHIQHIDQHTKVFFYGRKKELGIIDDNCKNFIEGKGSKSILIKGEMGIGKTWLKDKLISNNFNEKDTCVFENVCYQFEKEHRMKTWKNIIINLLHVAKQDSINIPRNIYSLFKIYDSDLDIKDSLKDVTFEGLIDLLRSDIFEDLIIALFNIITGKKKLVLVFEDIHWMDADSMSALVSILSRINQQKVMFVLTCRNEIVNNLKTLYVFANSSEKVQIIELFRYTKKEAEDFINKALPNLSVSKEILDKIYAETEGNTFFLAEYLSALKSKKDINIMTTKMNNILESKFLDMSKEEKKISEITSLFDDGAPLFIFKELLEMDEIEIIDLIENLEKRSILEEISNKDQLCFKFTHRKLHEFQYINLSHVRKSVLHNRVGKLLQGRLGNDSRDIDLYYQIAYHFKNANNVIEFLTYKIKILNTCLDFSHERFPILRFETKIYNQFDFNEKRTKKKIDEIEDILEKIKQNNKESIDVLNLEMAVLHIKGRYMIRRGIYEDGQKCIKSMMEIAQEVSSLYYLIEGCKQIILYCIQTNNPDLMMKYINHGYELVKEQKSIVNKDTFVRYDAMHKKMIGDIETAEDLIKECIELLSRQTRSTNQYILHIAACYDEMGEIKRLKGEFLEALNYYEKAIAICEQKNVWISISLFYTHAGEIAYWINKYDVARKYFGKALEVFNRIEYNAGQSIAEAYMSLILLKEADYKSALEFLLKADKNANILKTSREIGTVLRVKCEFRFNMERDPKLNELSKNYLNESLEYYIQEGIKILKAAKEDYQTSILKDFVNNNFRKVD